MSRAGRDQLHVAVVGGRFGAQVHAPALERIRGVRVVGVVESRGDAGRRRLEALLPELDAITVAVPPLDQGTLVRRALNAGVAVLAEKPLAPCAAEARSLAELARHSPLPTAVDFEFASLPPFQRAAALLETDALGRCTRVDVRWTAPSWVQQHRVWNWKSDLDAGGGVLNLLGTHALHLGEHLLGPITRVAGTLDATASEGFAPIGARAAEDRADLCLHTTKGVRVSMHLSNRAGGAFEHRWTFHCTGGSFMVRSRSRDYVRGFSVVDLSGRAVRPLWSDEAPQAGDGRVEAFSRVARPWLEAVRRGPLVPSRTAASAAPTPPWPTFEQAARVQGLIERLRGAAGGSGRAELDAAA